MIVIILSLVTWLIFLTMYIMFKFSDVENILQNHKRIINNQIDKYITQNYRFHKIEQELNELTKS